MPGFISDAEMEKMMAAQGQAGSGFISDDDMDRMMKAQEKPKTSLAETALKHGLQGASAGFLDEVSGATEAAGRIAGIKGLGGDFSGVGMAEGGPTLSADELKKAYLEARDKKRAQLSQMAKENPMTAGAANFAGMVASPVNKIAGGMSLAKGGAALGAINATGSSEADSALGVAKDAALGALTGAAIGKATEKVAPIVSGAKDAIKEKLGGKAKDMAELWAAKALGAERGTVKKLGIDKAKEIGRYALDEGIVSPLASTDDLVARNAAKMSEGGEMMGQVYGAIDDAGKSTFNPLDAAVNVEKKIGDFYRSPINKGETNQLENTLESILMRGEKNIPLTEAQALKQELGKVANWKNNVSVTDKEKMARDAYGVVSDMIDKATEKGAESINNPVLNETLKRGKALFGAGKGAETLLENKVASGAGNKWVSLTDWGVLSGGGAATAATGGMAAVPTAVLYGAKKAAEKWGAGSTAVLMDKTAKYLMQSSPKLASMATKDPRAFGAIVSSIASHIADGGKLSLPRAADVPSVELRGEDKWAADGAENLKAHDPSVTDEQIQKLSKSKKGREILMQASSFKPGSKAMNNLRARLGGN